MNREMEAPELLRNAAKLVDRALLKLDMREYPCLECGTRHFRNRAHAKVYEALTNTPLRLQEAANRLENKDGDLDAQAAIAPSVGGAR